ncbi:programmed cell death protein 7-like isoform X2 [Limulus polyphemus]|uniref:Programmed cell death protein 7-like isoform X2 n=1 Tax=Limulus polyphemus TaxID=6850 RepID=A0ABM1BBQ4_LIMPO|nr:programmed cell death protein 7-like isoform X2 [Limulus polyphemus]
MTLILESGMTTPPSQNHQNVHHHLPYQSIQQKVPNHPYPPLPSQYPPIYDLQRPPPRLPHVVNHPQSAISVTPVQHAVSNNGSNNPYSSTQYSGNHFTNPQIPGASFMSFPPPPLCESMRKQQQAASDFSHASYSGNANSSVKTLLPTAQPPVSTQIASTFLPPQVNTANHSLCYPQQSYLATTVHGPTSSGSLHIPTQLSLQQPQSLFAPVTTWSSSCMQGPITQSSAKTLRESDNEWLEGWLSSKKKPNQQVQRSEQKSDITIAYARSHLQEALVVLKELNEVRDLISSSLMTADDDMWNFRLRRATRLQNRLAEIKEIFLQPAVLKNLKQRMEKIRKKRKRIKKQKEYRTLQMKEIQSEREEKERQIGIWKEQIIEKIQRDKREMELKAEADTILSEVRRKIQEAKRALERLKALEKLRDVKKKNLVMKGVTVSIEYDDTFMERVSRLRELMKQQLSDYEAEERAIKVMLETEHEGQREEEEERRRIRIERLVKDKQWEIKEGLFGNSCLPSVEDPLYIYWQFYVQAEQGQDQLLHIRREWDMFLVPSDHPEGSSIPLQWITPEAPSSQVWASALQPDSI